MKKILISFIISLSITLIIMTILVGGWYIYNLVYDISAFWGNLLVIFVFVFGFVTAIVHTERK